MSNQSIYEATKPQSKLVRITYMNPFSIFIFYDAGVRASVTIPPGPATSHQHRYWITVPTIWNMNPLYLSSFHTSSSCYDHKITNITAIQFPAAHGQRVPSLSDKLQCSCTKSNEGKFTYEVYGRCSWLHVKLSITRSSYAHNQVDKHEMRQCSNIIFTSPTNSLTERSKSFHWRQD